jgi:hypothetical protein
MMTKKQLKRFAKAQRDYIKGFEKHGFVCLEMKVNQKEYFQGVSPVDIKIASVVKKGKK